jgi:hypothetical protein
MFDWQPWSEAPQVYKDWTYTRPRLGENRCLVFVTPTGVRFVVEFDNTPEPAAFITLPAQKESFWK